VRLRVRRLPEGPSFRELTLADVPVQDESRTLRIIRQLRCEREESEMARPCTVGLAAATAYCLLLTVVLEAFFRLKYVAANRAAASTPRVPRNEILKGKFLPAAVGRHPRRFTPERRV